MTETRRILVQAKVRQQHNALDDKTWNRVHVYDGLEVLRRIDFVFDARSERLDLDFDAGSEAEDVVLETPSGKMVITKQEFADGLVTAKPLHQGGWQRVSSIPDGSFVLMLTSADYADEVLANIDARFDCWVAKYGRRRALHIYYCQCFGAVLSRWVDWTITRLVRLKDFIPKT